MSEKIKVMQTPKRMLIGGHMCTVFLTDYDASNDTYFGEAHRNRKVGDEQTPVVTSVTGARPYPYAERPDYSFQFVECGADEQPLIDIASANAGHHQEVLAESGHGGILQVTDDEPTFDERDTNQDGTVSKAEKKAWRREHEGE